MDESPPRPWKQVAKKAARLLFTLLTLAGLVWLLDRIGWSVIGSSFLRIGWGGAALLLVIGLAEGMLNAASLCAATGWRVGLLRVLSYSGAGTIANNIIPWDAGEVLKGTLLSGQIGTRDAIYSMVVWNYVMKLSGPTASLSAAVLAVVLGHGLDPNLTVLVISACVASFALFFVVRFFLARGVAELFVRTLHRLRLLRKDPEQLMESARLLDREIKTLWQERPWELIAIFLFQFLAKAVSWASWLAVIRLVGLDYSVGLCSFSYAGYLVLSYLTPVIPAKIGVNEGAGYLLFAFYGLDGGTGLIIVAVGRLKALLVNGMVGVFAFIGRPGRRPGQ